jgi:predicted enzyme related to lactoylglutathione lyase
MPDPFDALRSPMVPVAPDPRFAARLRRRLLHSLSPTAPPEEHMTNAQLRHEMSRNGTRHGDISYISLGLPDDTAGRAFYTSVLGWRFAPGQVDEVGNQVDEVIPQIGLWSGPEAGPLAMHGATLSFRVDDIATSVTRVTEQGGTAEAPETRPYGLEARCTDGDGLGFWLHQLAAPGLPAPPNGTAEGDVSYVTLMVADADRARGLFAAVLGWEFSPGHAPGGWNVEGPTPMLGMSGGQGERIGAVLGYQIDDIAAAVERVRSAGGTATGPDQRPYGLEANCTDDQGIRFYLHEFPEDVPS